MRVICMFRYGADDLDHGGAAHLASERSGVTGACMLLRAKDFLQVGGFSEQFPLSFNDVDLSLKIVTAGFRILYTRTPRCSTTNRRPGNRR